ncbi:TetR/AcrR family transcriptional regulator [Alkalimarinus alittae]|uniref:TetR family transcriptional regulator C-terminal domain-containing protein n=1 Tax=Alkalimarinus alittae TaxID=2961619 RepID=A0ABY6N6K9_9ALTE|nr:TetR family transcriptional regulator C-terminal domain-containing protein [Alkalimarinus alittae]UZE97724.1 TetR family transcriptional regulator C-terminal domain-containing protein [Alkalimarinus alittae]
MNAENVATTKEFESLKSSIQYQGRKAARAKSEHRRREILEAALRIVSREGIRGVKHRAVAKEASVPLASTTYYFKDIEELISDAFMLFAEKSLQVLDLFYGELNKLVETYDVKQIHNNAETKEKFSEDLISMGVAYIKAQVKFRREDLLAEMAFLLEAVRDERLKPLARDYRAIWYSRLIDFLTIANAPAPKEDAMFIISSVQGLLYEGIVSEGEIDEVKTRAILKRAIHLLMQP